MKIMNRDVCAGAVAMLMASTGAHAEVTANAAVSNNYLWRGLTQSENDPSISGGFDYANESGFYIGTWVSNVSYLDSDPFSYEHDIYFGYSGGTDTFTYDFGYLYYNYDSLAKFDFGEIYGTLGYGDFSVTAYILANTEAEEGNKPFGAGELQDFGFGEAYYLSLDYGVALADDLGLAFHVGQHSGDFAEAFNGVTESYLDYSISLTKGNFAFTISDTDLDPLAFDDSGSYILDPNLTNEWSGNDNGSVKFVVSYSMDLGM